MNLRGLLGMLQTQPDQFQSLLGEYYDPKTAKMKWLGGTLQGLGMGLASGQPGAWATGLTQGGGQAVDDYRKQAMLGYQAGQQAEDKAYGREQDAKTWQYRAAQDAESKRRWEAEQARLLQAQKDQAAWQNLVRQNTVKGWQESDALKQGQTNAVNAWTNNFKSQGGDLFSPEMQTGLRAQGVQGVDPMDTVKFRQAQPLMQGGAIGSAYDVLATPSPVTKGVTADVEQRKAAALGMGLTPDDPAYKSYVLTGKMPREDQAPLTATDKKAILEADEAVQANTQTIDLLKSVIDSGADGKTPSLNDKAGSGYWANVQPWLARNDPTGLFDDVKGQNTTQLQNIILNQALGSLKSIFGGNPTEGERAILLDLQASVDKTPEERKPIIERAIKAANARLAFNQQRAAALRGGDYYKTGGAPTGPITVNGFTIEKVGP